jgi:hypothetical protein
MAAAEKDRQSKIKRREGAKTAIPYCTKKCECVDCIAVRCNWKTVYKRLDAKG